MLRILHHLRVGLLGLDLVLSGLLLGFLIFFFSRLHRLVFGLLVVLQLLRLVFFLLLLIGRVIVIVIVGHNVIGTAVVLGNGRRGRGVVGGGASLGGIR